jgi:nucleoside-diphosphate-sugar epimerase
LKKIYQSERELEVLGSGAQVRDYCYVDDGVRALKQIMREGESGESYNLSGGNVISINKLAEMMIEMCGKDLNIRNTQESWQGDIRTLEADASKLRTLGFKPRYELENGLKNLIDYYESELT